MSTDSKNDYKPKTSSVGRAIRSFSQALGITKSQFDAQKIVAYRDGKFMVNNKELEKILVSGTDSDQLMALQLLEEEMLNISMTKRIRLWQLVKGNVNLKKEGPVRSEALKVLEALLKYEGIPDISVSQIYKDLYTNINFTIVDCDLKLFLRCFIALTNVADLNLFEKSTNAKLADFLIQLFKQALKVDEEVQTLIILLVSDCIKKDNRLFTNSDLEYLLDNIIDINTKTSNTLVIKSFVEFFDVYLLTDGEYINKIYPILSILGCANGLEEINSIVKCETFLDKLLADKNAPIILFSLCDVITGKFNNRYKCHSGDKSTVGSIRYFGYLLKYLGSSTTPGEKLTSFFRQNLHSLLDAFITVAKCNDPYCSIEILKFIDEILEKPYTLKGYYKYLIQQNYFWDLLSSLNWSGESDIMYSYKVVQNELFNKLQNFKMSPFYDKKLIDYFESNYRILSSYNIEFVLEYYSENYLCVCGSSKWKQNCESIIEKYYSISPDLVLNILKNAFLDCNSLKIDEKSLNFYISMICYTCVMNLPFQMDDNTLEPITDVILELNDNMFEKIVDDYTKEIEGSADSNIDFMNKALIILVMKAFHNKIHHKKIRFILQHIIKLAKSSENLKNQKVFAFQILLLVAVRATTKDRKKFFYIEELTAEHLMKSSMINEMEIPQPYAYQSIDEKINQSLGEMFYDFSFMRILEKYFINRKSNLCESYFDMNVILSLYKDILENTTHLGYYLFILKYLRNQLLNYELFEDQCSDKITELLILFTDQLQNIYTFNLILPKWMKIEHVRIIIIHVLYGFLPYKKLIAKPKGENMIRSIALDFHFAKITRSAFLNFLNCCLFEVPEMMRSFILPILKIIYDDLNKIKTFFSSLTFLFQISKLQESFKLNEKENELILDILDKIQSYQIENEKTDFNYIICCKILAEFVGSRYKEKPLQDRILKPKCRLEFIKINNQVNTIEMFNKIIHCLKTDDISKDCNINEDIKVINYIDLGSLSSVDNDDIKIILIGQDIDIEDINYYLGKKIIIKQIDNNNKYYNINNYNFKYINTRDAVIDEANIDIFITILVELCLISTVK
jgi:hypothetical protein